MYVCRCVITNLHPPNKTTGRITDDITLKLAAPKFMQLGLLSCLLLGNRVAVL